MARPTARGDRAPTGRRAGPAPRTPGRRRSASRPIGPSPSRGPRATHRAAAARARLAGAPGPRPGSAASPRSTCRDASAACARWRWASVRPGIATWSGSSAIRTVNGSARVSRSISDPANATRPSRMPTASTQPKPESPARVAIRPVRSMSRGMVGQRTGSARSSARSFRPSPAPRPSASATRALMAHSVPTGMAPARAQVAPPPGNA